MDDFQEIEELWNEFRKILLPKGLAETDEGFDLISLDTFTAGCIDTFVDNKGSLDKKRQKILENCRKDLETAVSNLEGESKVYFEKLLVLADKILRIIK